MSPVEKLCVETIKTENGAYFKHSSDGHYTGNSSLSPYLFDGKRLEKTNHPLWMRGERIPKRISRFVSQPNSNYRYELIDSAFITENTPMVIPLVEAGEYSKDTSDFVWNEKYAKYAKLYALKWDENPNKEIDIEFEIKIILEIDFIKEYAGFSYPVQRTQWAHEGYTQITQRDVRHNVIDHIVFPGIVLQGRECKLTSEQSYKIIRKHVQDNINPKYAVITSDYDFCFTVCKKIPLVKPIEYRVDVSRFGARKPKMETRMRLDRSVEIFKMGHSGNNGPYKGYEAIDGFQGANIEELKKNIDEFLSTLMEKINEPLCDCPKCNGAGVIFPENKA